MRKAIAFLSVFCVTLVATQVALAQPSDPNAAQFSVTEAAAGSNDTITGLAGAVTGLDWVYVYADASQTTLLATAQSAADGSIAAFSIGDGATVNGVILNNQVDNTVYAWAWDGALFSSGYITLDNDVVGPVLTGSSTFDTDGDGKVDKTTFTFDENISDVASGNVNVYMNVEIEGQGCTDFSTGSVPNDNTCSYLIIVDAQEVPGTGYMDIAFTDHASAGITDALGNEALDFTDSADDLAAPVFVGVLDGNFSRTVDDKELIAYVSENLNAAEAVQEFRYRMTQFYVVPFNVAYQSGVSWGSRLTMTVSENYTYSWNTDATGTDAGNGTNNLGIQQTLLASCYVHDLALVHDLSGNPMEEYVGQASPFSDVIDNAPPKHIYGEYRDINLDGTVDEVGVVFSEQLLDTPAPPLYEGWTVNNITGAEVDGLSLCTYGDWGDFENTLCLSLDPGSNDVTYFPNAVVNYTPGNITDVNSIPAAAFSTFPLEDFAAPQLVDGNGSDMPIAYYDTDNDGMINEVVLNYTEDVICNTLAADWTAEAYDLTGFDLVGPYACAGSSLTIGAVTDPFVTGAVGGGTEPTITYLGSFGEVADAAGNVLAPFIGETILDKAAPIAVVYEYFDTDVPYPNGDVDRFDLTYSEDVIFSFAPGNWAITGGDLNMDYLSLITDPPYASDNDMLTFPVDCDNNETGVNDGTEPVISYDDVGGPGVTDLAGNTAWDQVMTLVDKAAPFKLNASYWDNLPLNGQVDNFTMDFTENIEYTFVAGDWDVITRGDINLGDVTDVVITDYSLVAMALGDECTTGTDSPSGDEPSIYYENIATGINDGKGNLLTQISSGLTDHAPGVPCGGNYTDDSGNGTVDLVELNFSENLTNFVYSAADWDFTPNPLSFAITGYTQVDKNLFFDVDALVDLTGVNGGTEPSICYTNNACNVKDWQNNCLEDDCWEVIDEAAPIILDFAYYDNDVDGTVETIEIMWSEFVTFTFDLADWDLFNNDDLNLVITGASHTDNHTQFAVDADALETGCDDNGNPELSYDQQFDHVFDISPQTNAAEWSPFHEIYDDAAPFCYDYYYQYDSWSVTNFVSEFYLSWTENLDGDVTDFAVWSMTDDCLHLNIDAIFWSDGTNTIEFLVEGDANETGCNGGAEPIVNFLGTDELDDEWGNTPDFSSYTLRDLAIPQQYDWVYLDADIDGRVETVVVEYTEYVNFAWNSNDWAFGNNIDLNLGFSSVAAEDATISFTVTSDPNETGCDNNGNPTIAYTNNNNRITDISLAGNIAPSTIPTEVPDGAAPFCIMGTGTYTDVNADGTVDRVDLHFTEDLTGFTYAAIDWPIEGGDLDLVIQTAFLISNSSILFAVEGDPCETGVNNDFGIEPNFIYTPNAPEHIMDAAGNITGEFSRGLIDDAAPVLNDCDMDALAYTDDNHNGVVDHVYIRYTEPVFCNTAAGVWEVNIPLINYYPDPTAVEGSGTSELGLTGFSVPAYMTFLEDATLALTSGSVVWDNNGNFLDAFPATQLADEAEPVAYIVQAESDPIFLGERQHLDIVFSELVVQDGSLDPDVIYSTNGEVQRDVPCSTSPEWVAYFYPQFSNIVQSQYSVDADDVILFGETGEALIGISGAVDENGNVMAVCPPYPDEYNFSIDARAAILISTNSVGEIEAGVPFMVHLDAMDAGGTILDEYYGEFVEFSTNLDEDQIIMPAGAVPLIDGVGDFMITVMEPIDEFFLYVREEGGRIDNLGNGEGPYPVVAPTIDAPDASWAEDSPEDQGNFIDLFCEFSDNDPASPLYDEDLVGYNYVAEYRWYRDTGDYLVLIAQTPQDDLVDIVYERYDTEGDTSTYDYYVAAWSNSGSSGPLTGGGFDDAVRALDGRRAMNYAPGVYYSIGDPDARVGDIIRVNVGDYPEMTSRETDYSSPLVFAGRLRPFDNIPPRAVEEFAIAASGQYDLDFDWNEVDHGINGSIEINPIYYHIYRGTAVDAIDELVTITTDIGWIDNDVVGNPETNYFYRIAANDWDNESELSLILGEYDYLLQSAAGTDWNYIGLPLKVGLTDAEELVDALEGSDGAADWVSDQQGWDTYAPLRSNFDLEDGHAYLVNYPEGETVYTFIGEAVLDVNFQLVTTTTTDWNDVGVPLTETGIESLGDLVAAIDFADAAALFNTEAQSWYVYFNGFPEEWDRDITVGQAVLVNVTDESSWPETGLERGNGEIWVEDAATDAPHLVWGNIYNEDGSPVGAETMVNAYILGRENDILSTTDFAVQVSDGFYSIQVGDFNQPWRAGETIRLEFRDNRGYGANSDLNLSWEVADNGGVLVMEELPTEYALYQNYPNPFNPTTVVPFDLVDRTLVDITVYNMLGKKVATVLNENLPAGHHEVTWNGSNSYGHQVASGVYFIRMNAADFVTTKKLMKVK